MFNGLENKLNADLLQTPKSMYFQTEFEKLLDSIYGCYEEMLLDKINVPNNDENEIRDRLLIDYLNNNLQRVKFKLLDFLFDPEVPVNSGRSDIKISTKNTFENTDAYYIIECKRLDGYSTLNKEYQKNGINRFLTTKYPSHYKINGMIGFIVKEIDIDANMKKIGNFFNLIEKDKLYNSDHEDLKIYHLMMDFSNNIKVKN